VVTPGAKPIIFFTLLALVDEGDEVIYPDPGFPIYICHQLRWRKGVPLPLRENVGFAFILTIWLMQFLSGHGY